MKKILLVSIFLCSFLQIGFGFEIKLSRVLPDYSADIRIIDSHYTNINICWISEKEIALGVNEFLSILNIEKNLSIHKLTAEKIPYRNNIFVFLETKSEMEGLFYYWNQLNDDYLYDTKTDTQYRISDPEVRAEILDHPEEIYRSFRYAYEGDNYLDGGRKGMFRIFRTDNYTMERELLSEAAVQDIFPGIRFNARSRIIDISEDGTKVLVSVGRGHIGSIFAADFDGTRLSNARELMYDYVPDAVFVGNDHAAIPVNYRSVGTEGNGLWELAIFDLEGRQVASVEDVLVGDSLNQFDADEAGRHLVLAGVYKDQVGVYLFDVIR